MSVLVLLASTMLYQDFRRSACWVVVLLVVILVLAVWAFRPSKPKPRPVKCPRCGGTNTAEKYRYKDDEGKEKAKWACGDCGAEWDKASGS